MARYGFDPETGRLNVNPEFFRAGAPDPYGRPSMAGVSTGEARRRDVLREARRQLVQDIKEGRGGQGDADMHLVGGAETAVAAAAAASSLPASVVSTAPLVAQAWREYDEGGWTGLANSSVTPQAVTMALPFAVHALRGAKRAPGAVSGYIDDLAAEPTPQKTNLLKAMYDAWSEKTFKELGNKVVVMGPEDPVAHPAVPRRTRPAPRPREPLAVEDGQPVEDSPVIAAKTKAELSKDGKVKISKADSPDVLPKKPLPAPEPFDPAELLSQKAVPVNPGALNLMPGPVAQDRWYGNLVKRFGSDVADRIRDTFNSKWFKRFFYGDDPAETTRLLRKYEALRSVYDKIAEPGEILLGGSSSIGSEGTIVRSEIGHDLDFQAPIANASRRTDIGTPEATAAMVAALKNRANIENAPVIQKLRRLYPQLKDAKFRYAERKFQWWGDEKYQPDVFTVAIPEPAVTPTGEANLMVNVLLDGQKVDLMLTDSAMFPSKGNPRLGRAKTALHWKAAYLDEALKKGKPLSPGQQKHKADLARYREYSENNMLVDPRSRRTQFSPFDFPENSLVDENGMPMVGEMETFPGSGERVPVIMNPRGRILMATDPTMLDTWYNPRHPQNNPRYAGPPASKDTKPLVAIRGAERHIRAPVGELTEGKMTGMGFQGGEPAPGIGIYPANNPELLADEIIKGGRWSTYHNGKHKDMVFYPRRAIDPQADSGNVLHGEDAYWPNPYSYYYNEGNHVSRALDLRTAEAIDDMGRHFGRMTRVPTGQFTEIGNAYRNFLYEINPEGHYNAPPGRGFYEGYGEARHLGRTPDGAVVPGELIDKDPAKARAMIIDLVKKGMFLAPLAAGALATDEETQQAAKGGKAPDRFALSRNFLATDEVPETLFGIPIAADGGSWTDKDIAFFRKHPEAGGYYDMGDDEEGAPEEPPVQAANKAGDASEEAIPSKTRSDSEAVQALYKGVAPAAAEAMRARTIRARGGDPDKVTLGEIATTGAPVERGGFDPEPHGRYKVEYRPDKRRSVAMTARGVAEIADHTAQREELTHLLDPGGAESVPQGWTREPGEPLGDLYQRRAQAVNGDAADRHANYYVYGRRSEREMAMSILKQAIGRNFAAAGGDPVERTSGAAILGMLSDYADHKSAPGDNLPFMEEAKGDGYSFHRLKADDKASMPGKKVLQEYIRLYRKTKDGEPLNEVEREAWEQLSNPDAWDRVVSVDRFGKAVRAAEGGGKAKRKIPPIVKGPIHYGPPPPPSRGKYPGIANNPGNVEKHERRSDKTLFKGEIAGGVRPKRFANFSDPVDGLTAAATVLSRRAAGLAAKGLPFTIENYVPGYAPKSENDVEGYIGNLSRYSGFARDEELDPGDVDDMAKLLRNVVRFESGVPHSEWFTDDEYRQAALAMQEGAVD